jgi:DNA mismatch repair protein MutL
LGLFAAREEKPQPITPTGTGTGPGTGTGTGTTTGGFFAGLRYLGQLHKTYLICQGDGELVLIDQHAAHERVAFERLRAAHRERATRTQRLLFPQTIELDEGQAAAVNEHADVLATLGFELEHFGGNAFAVKAVPEVLSESAISEVISDIIGELGAIGTSEVVAERIDRVMATMACHSVVRAGDVLDDARARALLDSMDGVDYRAHCPHGRPVLLRMSLGEIERRFGRT